jgi:hypothetical protein
VGIAQKAAGAFGFALSVFSLRTLIHRLIIDRTVLATGR